MLLAGMPPARIRSQQTQRHRCRRTLPRTTKCPRRTIFLARISGFRYFSLRVSPSKADTETQVPLYALYALPCLAQSKQKGRWGCPSGPPCVSAMGSYDLPVTCGRGQPLGLNVSCRAYRASRDIVLWPNMRLIDSKSAPFFSEFRANALRNPWSGGSCSRPAARAHRLHDLAQARVLQSAARRIFE